MKKVTVLLLASALLLCLVACGGGGKAEIAMVTGLGELEDGSFNQGTWQGVSAFAAENEMTVQYYRPGGDADEDFLAAIDAAVKGAAKVVVAPGFTFAAPIGTAQNIYPDVRFILIDAMPEGGAASNTVGVTFAEQQAGYLAGYAVVKDGHTKLGFMGGMPVASVIRYGFGYMQGAADAAEEMGVQVEMNYGYLATFDPSDKVQDLAAQWYTGGTEVIFGCAGGASASVIAAAQAAGAWAVGVDVDQSGEGEAVLTSAMKGLDEAARQTLAQYHVGEFPGGRQLILGAKAGAVALPMETSRFTKFSQADYTAVYQRLAEDAISLPKENGDGSPLELADELPALTVYALSVQ